MNGPVEPTQPYDAGAAGETPADRYGGVFRTLSLRSVRSQVRGWPARSLALGVGIVVGFASLLAGGMLVLLPTQGAYTPLDVVYGGGPSSWWFFPEVIIVQPWGYLQLPWLPALAMLLVAVGAGLGSAASVGVLARWLRQPRTVGTARSAAGVAAGAGPGLASLATLGACCCTSCTSAAGLAIVAAASGTSVGTLFRVDWFLPVFQVGVVYLSLLAQERALQRPDSGGALPSARDPRFIAGALLRIGLLVAGTTWSLAMFVEWGSIDPAKAPAGLWYHWIFEHQLLAMTAIVAALFPREFSGWFELGAPRFTLPVARVALLGAAVSWGTWVPPALTSIGLGGLVNELLGYLGQPGSWGAIAPDAPVGPGLVFHWAFQHLLLAGFAAALALAPHRALAPIRATLSTESTVGPSGIAAPMAPAS
ncbi:MAG TPA: hypothetical protein VGX00_04935 [Thermoplasmata archaeon]|nr:hypothetical protein [Thermoplasmata archaeon]